MVKIVEAESPGIEQVGRFGACRILVGDTDGAVSRGKQIPKARVTPLCSKQTTMKFVSFGQMCAHFVKGRDPFG